MKRKAILICLLLIIFCSPIMAQVKVIVHPQSSYKELDVTSLRNIFLGKIVAWPDGTKIYPVIRSESTIQNKFVKDILKMSPRQFSLFWKRILFTGTGVPPKSLKTSDEVVAFIANSKGAIGFVESSIDFSGVTEINIK